jgi:hypothetical protein
VVLHQCPACCDILGEQSNVLQHNIGPSVSTDKCHICAMVVVFVNVDCTYVLGTRENRHDLTL